MKNFSDGFARWRAVGGGIVKSSVGSSPEASTHEGVLFLTSRSIRSENVRAAFALPRWRKATACASIILFGFDAAVRPRVLNGIQS